jgi:hypothetical protein
VWEVFHGLKKEGNGVFAFWKLTAMKLMVSASTSFGSDDK